MGIPGFITYYIFIAALTIGAMLVGLVAWHGRMIGRGVTSLERVLNPDYAHQCEEQGFIFVNPYDFGCLENWKRFLGASTIGEFIFKVLLPSAHKPEGDGVTWDGFNVNTNLQLHRPDLLKTTRPIAFPPGLYPNAPGSSHPMNRHRPIVPPWEKQRSPTSSSPSGYQPRPPSIANINAKKDH